MRGRIYLVLPIVLAACGMPSRHFRDVPAARVSVAGSVFEVRVRGELAESVRVNSQYAPRLGPIRDRAALAMAIVSGCDVIGVLGDQAVQLGQLDCGEGTARAPGAGVPPGFDCLQTPSGVSRSDGSPIIDFECTAYWQ